MPTDDVDFIQIFRMAPLPSVTSLCYNRLCVLCHTTRMQIFGPCLKARAISRTNLFLDVLQYVSKHRLIGVCTAAATNDIPIDIFSQLAKVDVKIGDFFRYGALWICEPCMSDRAGNPGIGRLFGVPDARNNFHTRNLLIYPTKPISRTTIPGTDLVFNMLPYFQQSVPAVSFGIGEVSKQFYLDRNSSDQFLNTSFERRLRRYVTSLVARMPILSIAEADKQLPKVSRDGAKERHYVTTSLDVKWKKVGATIGAIIGWQILAILIVFHYCKHVYIRDNSFLADVRLLKTLMMKFEGGSLSTGEELAACLDETDAGFTYGTKLVGKGFVVDLSDDVAERMFPLSELHEDSPKLRGR